ncbi:hypothetical protein [Pseudobutyrivibrio sp.]|uniref:hypothetical protein n=1 Tax=Pseudobutyrivibrio sp. TaxID=2014367 RepID=UPI001B574CCA|nr:hypothetical protein [Pseudobutyrivibrio sp.]MBP3261502.1 hypothetical protein [Pseudobutyrivibrio sp.]
MVAEGLKELSKIEKDIEKMAGDSSNDSADKLAKEARKILDNGAYAAASAVDVWGKQTLNKAKEITEEIII